MSLVRRTTSYIWSFFRWVSEWPSWILAAIASWGHERDLGHCTILLFIYRVDGENIYKKCVKYISSKLNILFWGYIVQHIRRKFAMFGHKRIFARERVKRVSKRKCWVRDRECLCSRSRVCVISMYTRHQRLGEFPSIRLLSFCLCLRTPVTPEYPSGKWYELPLSRISLRSGVHV